MNNDVRLLDSSVVIRHFRQGGAISARLETFSTLYLPGMNGTRLRPCAVSLATPIA